MPGDIWWADVIRAHRALGGHPDGFGAVAKALGFAIADRASGTPRPAFTSVPDDEHEDGSQQPDDRRLPPGGSDDALSEPANPSVLEPLAEEPIITALTNGPVLPSPVEVQHTPLARHRPLLSPRSANGILQYLLSRTVADGPVDVTVLVAAIATGQPPTKLPRVPQRTLRFGVQVLVDLSESTRPFRLDQLQVVDTINAVMGPTSTSVRYFADAPLRGAGTGTRWTWRSYEPPAPGTQVLLLTDFGIGGDQLSPSRSSPAEWLALFTVLRGQDCQPVALVPYPPARWPRRLRAACPMLMWDRNVTVGHARTATS